jgi:hypothetical protein
MRHSGSSGGRRRKISVRRCSTSSVTRDPAGVGIVALACAVTEPGFTDGGANSSSIKIIDFFNKTPPIL